MDSTRPEIPFVSLPHEGERAPAGAPPGAGMLYGLMAEFVSVEALAEATHKARAEGYNKMDAYSPFPSHDIAEALGVKGTRLPLLVLAGGVFGLVAGYMMQYYTAVIDYPINVGGRPLHSWVSFLPVTFEMTILCAALAAIFGMLALNGLPMPYHPVFNVERFSEVTRDRFFLVIESTDPKFDYTETRRFLDTLSPEEVMDVPQ